MGGEKKLKNTPVVEILTHSRRPLRSIKVDQPNQQNQLNQQSKQQRVVTQKEMLLNLLLITLLQLLHQAHGSSNFMLHGADIARTWLQLGKLSAKTQKLVKLQQKLPKSIVLNTTQSAKKMK